MKAIQFHELGGPEVLKLEDVDIPEPRRGWVRIKAHAIGMNFADIFFRQGQYLIKPKLPDIPGMEAAGVIDAVGPEVSHLKPGMRVTAIGVRTYAEYCTVSAAQVIPLPDFVSYEEGAAFPIQTLTAYHMLHTSHQTTPGQTVLVHSAAGGVGIVAVQIAKAAGARVIGTVSNDSKIDVVKQYGADAVINYATSDFAEETKKLTDGKGVDLILDAVGKPTLEKGIQCLRPFGHLILYGRAGGVPDPLNLMTLFQNSLKVSGFVLYTVSAMPDKHKEGIEKSFQLMQQGKLKMLIGKKFALADAAEAHRHMESRQSVGKLVLVP
ncbi:MAG TPA: quinone oxidoreductase [Methylomirabilota bacterium]|jgi:NADPH2:quinone reductase|nr:quinone oxidoreductase [Methylomirabilota bacterium]